MKIIRSHEKGSEGLVTYYKCPSDGTILWKEFDDGHCIRGNDCKHFYWEGVGNGCYPVELDPEICRGTDQIAKKRIKKIEEGTTVWFLLEKKR